MEAAPQPAPRAFSLNVVAQHYYALDLAVSVAGADDRYAPQVHTCPAWPCDSTLQISIRISSPLSLTIQQ